MLYGIYVTYSCVVSYIQLQPVETEDVTEIEESGFSVSYMDSGTQ